MTETTTTTEPWYWPEEGTPSFVSETGHDGTWVPLCSDCGDKLTPLRGNSMANWECLNYYGHRTHSSIHLYLIWAEDFPDYYEEECVWVFEGTEHADEDLYWWNCTTHGKSELGDSPSSKGYPDYCEEG